MWLTTNWIYSYNKLQLWFIPQPQRSQQTPSELVNPEDTSQFTRISQTITTRKRTRISCLRECNYVGTMTWIPAGNGDGYDFSVGYNTVVHRSNRDGEPWGTKAARHEPGSSSPPPKVIGGEDWLRYILCKWEADPSFFYLCSMKRQAHSHGAYQNFAHVVGAADHLLLIDK